VLRWLGAGLILCGGVLTSAELLKARRSAQRTRLALMEAFASMESEIRLLLTPLPVLLRQCGAGNAGAFFTRVSQALSSGEMLAAAWRDAADALPLPEDERTQLAAMGQRLGGTEESACAALSLAASALRRSYERAEAKNGEYERLITSICIGMSLFLVVLLL